MRFIATCKLGLESVVAGELRALGIEIDQVYDARITFFGDEHTLARALLWLRAAERVLLEVASFPANSFDELFEGVKALDWKKYLPRDANIHVNGKSAKSGLFSVSDCQRITKKAIVESLRSAYHTQTLPETGKEVIVEIGMLRDIATLALDACGAGLSRRGYRTYNVAAPLSETLGAGLVLLSRYRGDRPLIDPMCGSGTIPIEAAMIAQRRAPGLNRPFAAEVWHFLKNDTFKLAREQANDSILNTPVDIWGSDIDARSIQLCKQHAKKAGVMLNWAVRDFRELPQQQPGGILITNPPYGERMMEKKEAQQVYKDMRGAFSGLEGWSLHIITASSEFERLYGLRSSKRRKLTNGGMPCTLYQYFPKPQ
ncbi:class I SAM-dependent RNA methyltransferase [Eubacteriales bacterium OttesenSCG-928-K08]|nr:class I SAM-dependent RNA methyltransferase [Eubacteriales bacterium OttesenSCG-928-K08]